MSLAVFEFAQEGVDSLGMFRVGGDILERFGEVDNVVRIDNAKLFHGSAAVIADAGRNIRFMLISYIVGNLFFDVGSDLLAAYMIDLGSGDGQRNLDNGCLGDALAYADGRGHEGIVYFVFSLALGEGFGLTLFLVSRGLGSSFFGAEYRTCVGRGCGLLCICNHTLKLFDGHFLRDVNVQGGGFFDQGLFLCHCSTLSDSYAITWGWLARYILQLASVGDFVKGEQEGFYGDGRGDDCCLYVD